jgi:hypothetical protein
MNSWGLRDNSDFSPAILPLPCHQCVDSMIHRAAPAGKSIRQNLVWCLGLLWRSWLKDEDSDENRSLSPGNTGKATILSIRN